MVQHVVCARRCSVERVILLALPFSRTSARHHTHTWDAYLQARTHTHTHTAAIKLVGHRRANYPILTHGGRDKK